MPAVPAVPFLIGKSILTIEADDFTAHLNSAEGVPNTPSAQFRDIGGGVVTVYGTPSWLLKLGLAQDWTTDATLVNYLRLHHGETKTAKLTPIAGGRGVELDIVCKVTGFGGAAGSVATTTVDLDVNDQPVWDAAA